MESNNNYTVGDIVRLQNEALIRPLEYVVVNLNTLKETFVVCVKTFSKKSAILSALNWIEKSKDFEKLRSIYFYRYGIPFMDCAEISIFINFTADNEEIKIFKNIIDLLTEERVNNLRNIEMRME